MKKSPTNQRNSNYVFAPKFMTPQEKNINLKITQQYNVFAQKQAVSMGFIPKMGSECLWGVLMDAKGERTKEDGFQWFAEMVNKYQCDPEDLINLYESIHSELEMYEQLMDSECKRLGI
jgi:hypothetical protein